MKKNKTRCLLNWSWIKENFWNVVLIWLIWQVFLAIVYAIVLEVFGLQIA